jgi:hypothetical protein
MFRFGLARWEKSPRRAILPPDPGKVKENRDRRESRGTRAARAGDRQRRIMTRARRCVERWIRS